MENDNKDNDSSNNNNSSNNDNNNNNDNSNNNNNNNYNNNNSATVNDDEDDNVEQTTENELVEPKSEPPGSSTFQAPSPTPSNATATTTSPFPDQLVTSNNNSSITSPTNSTLANLSATTTTTQNQTPSHKTQAAFVNKLYAMVEDPSIQHLISWAPSGDVFSVSNPTEFSKSVLPQYFKHNNWQSFVRQLNMYGFHKVNDMFHANPSSESQAWEFKHPDFRRGQLASLQLIKRKSTKTQSQPGHIKGSGSASSLSPTGELNPADAIRDDRIERLSTQMTEMVDKMRQMHENYNLLYAETVSCRMLQTKHTQVITTITNLLASMCRDEEAADPRSLRKRKFEVDLLQAEVAKLGQNDTIPISSSHNIMPYGGQHMHTSPRSQSHSVPMIGVENTSSLHGMDPDYRPDTSPHHRSSSNKMSPQTQSPLAVLPEFGFPSYYPYLRQSTELGSQGGGSGNGGGTVSSSSNPDVSRSGGGGRSPGSYRTTPSITASNQQSTPSPYAGQHRSSHHHTTLIPNNNNRQSSTSTLGFGTESNLLNPPKNDTSRFTETSAPIITSQMQPQQQEQRTQTTPQRPPSASSVSSSTTSSSFINTDNNIIGGNPATSQAHPPPLPDPPDVTASMDLAMENKRRKRS